VTQRSTVWSREQLPSPIVHMVYLIFEVNRETLEIQSAYLSSSSTPCIDGSRFFPSTFDSWQGASHDAAYRNAADWLRSAGCYLPPAIVKMVLPNG